MRKFSRRAIRTALTRSSGRRNVATRSCLFTWPAPFGIRADQCLDLPDRHHRQKTDKQQEASKEEPKASDQDADVKHRRVEHIPRRRQKGSMERGYDDDKTLEPHSNVHEN